jgi:hypothetical protein
MPQALDETTFIPVELTNFPWASVGVVMVMLTTGIRIRFSVIFAGSSPLESDGSAGSKSTTDRKKD